MCFGNNWLYPHPSALSQRVTCGSGMASQGITLPWPQFRDGYVTQMEPTANRARRLLIRLLEEMAYTLFCLGYKQGWYTPGTAGSQHVEPENEANGQDKAEGWRDTKTGSVWILGFRNPWSLTNLPIMWVSYLGSWPSSALRLQNAAPADITTATS